MTYYAASRRVALSGSVLSDALKAGSDILQDPALPQVTKLVLRLNELQQKKPATKTKPATTSKAPGIGLSTVVKPLQMYVYTQENTWVIPVAIAAALAIPFLLGYKVGRRKRG